MIGSILKKIGYNEVLRKESNLIEVKAKKRKVNFKLFSSGLLFLFLIGFAGGILIHNGFLFTLLLFVPLFVFAMERDSYLVNKCKEQINQLHLDFFDRLEENQQDLKEIAKLSIDARSQNLFLSIVDNFLKKDDKAYLFQELQCLVEYHENLGAEQNYLSQRDSFMSSLDLPIQKREVVDDKSFQEKARERVLEML
jgi:hypothetical protein